MALKFKTSRDKFLSILSYPDRNGFEADTTVLQTPGNKNPFPSRNG